MTTRSYPKLFQMLQPGWGTRRGLLTESARRGDQKTVGPRVHPMAACPAAGHGVGRFQLRCEDFIQYFPDLIGIWLQAYMNIRLDIWNHNRLP
jgi:hypothetical protein